jgi:hypothetical protein
VLSAAEQAAQAAEDERKRLAMMMGFASTMNTPFNMASVSTAKKSLLGE